MDTAVTTALRSALDGLLALRDPEGVLTLYVDAEADLGSRHRPRGGELVLRSRLHELRERAHAEGPDDRARLLDARLDELAGSLSDALDPAGAGGGRAFFVTLSDGRIREAATRRPMGDEVALEDTALLMPLVGALVEEEPAGVVVLTAEGVRAVEVRGAEVEQVLSEDYAIPVEDWRPLVGPAAAGPAHQRESESQRDLFARRLEEHRRRRVGQIAPRLWREARRRAWTGVLASGPQDLVAALAAERPSEGPELVVADHRLPAALTAEQARRAAAGPLAATRIASECDLAGRVRDAALSASGRAAVGVDDVLTALAEGRVQHLLLDPRRRHAGARAADGRLVAAGEVLPGAGAAAPEPHLMERMLERALATGAGVTVLQDGAAEPLDAHGGIGAALRW